METEGLDREELLKRHDALEYIFNEVTRTGKSFTLYNLDGEPSLVIVEYHQHQAMLEMLQELGESSKEDRETRE